MASAQGVTGPSSASNAPIAQQNNEKAVVNRNNKAAVNSNTHSKSNDKTTTKPTKAPPKKAANITSKQLPVETSPAITQDPAALNRDRAALREKLTRLKNEIATAENQKADISDALKSSEQAISNANRRLSEINEKQHRTLEALQKLEEQINKTEADVSKRQNLLAKLLYRQYSQGSYSPWKALFSGENPQQLLRNFNYLAYVSQAQAAWVADLRWHIGEVERLKEVEKTHKDELEQLAQEEAKERDQLVARSQEHKALLAKLSVKLGQQRREADTLARDEKRLGQLIDQLSRLLAQRAKEEAAQKTKQEAQRLAQQRKEQSEVGNEVASNAPNKTPMRNEILPESTRSIGFERLRGKLRLPIKGEISARFGTPRQDGGPSWKGLFIRAQSGTEVRAVAAGRVVFAEWLRGFGNLVIVDHGDQYMSIYGNNETLFRQPGDVIKGGEVLASVGASGGQSESGLYFELRYQGRPFDPLVWASLKE